MNINQDTNGYSTMNNIDNNDDNIIDKGANANDIINKSDFDLNSTE